MAPQVFSVLMSLLGNKQGPEQAKSTILNKDLGGSSSDASSILGSLSSMDKASQARPSLAQGIINSTGDKFDNSKGEDWADLFQKDGVGNRLRNMAIRGIFGGGWNF